MARVALLILLVLAVAACSPKRMVVVMIADMLSEGDGAMVSDEDPELVREALPFGLKTYESLLSEVPEHRGLLEATAKGFTAYGYLLQQRADLVDERDLSQARELRARAHRLYLRGRDYALRGLELNHEGLGEALISDRAAACPNCGAPVESAGLVPAQPSMEKWALSRLSAGSPRRQIVDEIVQHGTMVRRDADELVKRVEAGSLAPARQRFPVRVVVTFGIGTFLLILLFLLRAAPA